MMMTLLSSKLTFRRLILRLLLGFVPGALGVLAYLPASTEAIRYAQGEMPELFTILGFYGASGLPLFLLSVLYGFILPLMVSLFAIHETAGFFTQALYDGRIAAYVASRHSRAAILFGHWLMLLITLLVLHLGLLLGQMLSAFLLFAPLNLMALVRLNLGLMAVGTLPVSLCFLIANLSRSEQKMRRGSWFVLSLMLLLLLLSRLQGYVVNARYFTFWSLFDGSRLVFGSGGGLTALVALLISFLMFSLSLLSFTGREL